MTAGTTQSPQASSEVCTWTLVEVVRWSDTKHPRTGHDSLTFLNLHMAHRASFARKKLYTVHQHSMGGRARGGKPGPWRPRTITGIASANSQLTRMTSDGARSDGRSRRRRIAFFTVSVPGRGLRQVRTGARVAYNYNIRSLKRGGCPFW